MHLDTRDCQQRVFVLLPTYAPSFTGQKEVVKLGRWFSWNAAASEQLPEFWIAKMLLEHHFEGSIPDPDEASATQVAFDDLGGAARAKTPQAELSQLKDRCHEMVAASACIGGVQSDVLTCKLEAVRTSGLRGFNHSGQQRGSKWRTSLGLQADVGAAADECQDVVRCDPASVGMVRRSSETDQNSHGLLERNSCHHWRAVDERART